MKNKMLERLLAQLAVRGLAVKRGANRGELLISGPGEEKTADVMGTLKAFKSDLLEWLDWMPPEEGGDDGCGQAAPGF